MQTEPAAAPMPVALADRIVRYADLVPCRNAFIDTRTPGSEEKENFTIIGPGVSENAEQHVHITEAHGFNVGGARQPPGCVNSQHSHDTAETFVVHSGEWRFTFGEHGEDSAIVGRPGDIVSFPTHAFRGFENIGDDAGFLWSVLGGDDPGRVMWAPRVFELARDYGLVLLENGALVDERAGQRAPEGVAPMTPTTPAQVAALHRVAQGDADTLIVRADDSQGSHVVAPGVAMMRVIGAGGAFAWDHGFTVDRITIKRDKRWRSTASDRPHVAFIQRGTVRITVDGAIATLAAGDTITFPRGSEHSIEASETEAIVFSVMGEAA